MNGECDKCAENHEWGKNCQIVDDHKKQRQQQIDDEIKKLKERLAELEKERIF